MKYSIIVLIYVLTSFLTFAQEEFSVLAVKGNVQVLKNGTGTPAKLFSGSKIMTKDVIQVADGGYIGLVHKSKNAIELISAGNYPATELAKKATSVTGVGSKVANYVADGMIKKSSTQSKTNLGSIERGEGGVMIEVPKKTTIIADEFPLSWRTYIEDAMSKTKAKGYIISIYGGKNLVYEETISGDTTLKLNLGKIKLEPNKEYSFAVAPSEQSAQNLKTKTYENQSAVTVNKLDATNIKALRDTADTFEKMGNTAIHKVMLANYYEQHNLNMEAIAAYETALRLAPGVEFYQKIYAEFLCKQGIELQDKAKSIYPNLFKQ